MSIGLSPNDKLHVLAQITSRTNSTAETSTRSKFKNNWPYSLNLNFRSLNAQKWKSPQTSLYFSPYLPSSPMTMWHEDQIAEVDLNCPRNKAITDYVNVSQFAQDSPSLHLLFWGYQQNSLSFSKVDYRQKTQNSQNKK